MGTEFIESGDLVCKREDDFIRDSPRWTATLSNNEVIYMDDYRPGLEESSAWLRLQRYCRENKLHIVEFWLQFRSNRILVEPANADGYYFVKSAWAIWGTDPTSSHHAFVAGALVDGKVRGAKWRLPELEQLERIERDFSGNDEISMRNRGLLICRG